MTKHGYSGYIYDFRCLSQVLLLRVYVDNWCHSIPFTYDTSIYECLCIRWVRVKYFPGLKTYSLDFTKHDPRTARNTLYSTTHPLHMHLCPFIRTYISSIVSYILPSSIMSFQLWGFAFYSGREISILLRWHIYIKPPPRFVFGVAPCRFLSCLFIKKPLYNDSLWRSISFSVSVSEEHCLSSQTHFAPITGTTTFMSRCHDSFVINYAAVHEYMETSNINWIQDYDGEIL